MSEISCNAPIRGGMRARARVTVIISAIESATFLNRQFGNVSTLMKSDVGLSAGKITRLKRWRPRAAAVVWYDVDKLLTNALNQPRLRRRCTHAKDVHTLYIAPQLPGCGTCIEPGNLVIPSAHCVSQGGFAIHLFTPVSQVVPR